MFIIDNKIYIIDHDPSQVGMIHLRDHGNFQGGGGEYPPAPFYKKPCVFVIIQLVSKLQCVYIHTYVCMYVRMYIQDVRTYVRTYIRTYISLCLIISTAAVLL